MSRVATPGGPTLVLVTTNAVIGVSLAILGLLMVMDRLSLRSLLARTGPEPAWQLAVVVHATIKHQGAQAVEFAGALMGLALIVMTISSFRRTNR